MAFRSFLFLLACCLLTACNKTPTPTPTQKWKLVPPSFEPLPEDLCKEWEKAGFEPGRASISPAVGFAFCVGNAPPDPGDMPAFRIQTWRKGFTDLPVPKRPFCLELRP